MKNMTMLRFLSLARELLVRVLNAVLGLGRNTRRAIEWHGIDGKREQGAFIVPALLLMVILVSFSNPVAAEDSAANSDMIRRLEALIQAQQQQMEEQQKQLDSLRQQVGELKEKTTESLTEAKDAKRVAEETQATAQAPAAAEDKVVHSGDGNRAKLILKGFVNRAVNIVDDGQDTETYYVDNDNAESRINLIGTLEATDDVTLGSEIELTIAPNKASNVNQLDQDTNNIFDQRKVQISLDSKRFGKFTLGKGDTASYHTGALDLSGTVVISTSTISDTAGGMFFRESGSGALTDLRILQAYNSWDGLNRQNRLRYDSPNFHGFKLSGSAISDGRYDAALRWGGKGNGFKVAAGAAIAEPKVSGDDLNYNGSISLLHENTGLNASFSAGLRERDNQNDPYNLFGKLGWRTQFFSVGETAFSVDYTRSKYFPAAGDEGDSFGLAAVQQFEKYGTEAYALYRYHSLDRGAAPAVDDIDVFSIGARVRF